MADKKSYKMEPGGYAAGRPETAFTVDESGVYETDDPAEQNVIETVFLVKPGEPKSKPEGEDKYKFGKEN